MAKAIYESEIRIIFDNIAPFLETLKSLNAQIIKKYSFKDHIYKPRGVKSWELEEKIMRIREWNEKSQLLFTKTRIIKLGDFSFKQTYFPKGKIKLYEGTLQETQIILKDWNFEFWFLIEKEEGSLHEIKKPFQIRLVVEKIKNLGYTAEIELWGEDINEICKNFQNILKILKIDRNDITYKPLPKIYYERILL
ncbi:MAG: hypothetical protein ACTSRG_11915 [Candidatus Helarchaeota archaeon]